ncbi:MAG: manganese efflux pump [Lachnospiraceae bacterium]|nr:manganese efflux pump [Lachnospiraceae bacterium]
MIAFLITSILLGIGLAMDAFSVSCANGLGEPDMKKGRMAGVAGVYAVFQFMMPMIGWLCVRTIDGIFAGFRSVVPWIALVLLLWIGGKMIFAFFKKDKEEEKKILTFGLLIVQGIATSVDALSVGFAIAGYKVTTALAACAIFGIETFIICVCGIVIGKKAGTKFVGKALLLGGIILITIGIEIFVKGLLG